MPGESEENNGTPGTDPGDSCVACHQYFDKEDECWGNYVPLTRDEEAILARMREVKAKVAEVKKRLKDVEGRNGFNPVSDHSAEGSDPEAQAQWLEQKHSLEVLRQEWQELDRKRQEAARFRMRILGHED
jgi:hypothetical protein